MTNLIGQVLFILSVNTTNITVTTAEFVPCAEIGCTNKNESVLHTKPVTQEICKVTETVIGVNQGGTNKPLWTIVEQQPLTNKSPYVVYSKGVFIKEATE